MFLEQFSFISVKISEIQLVCDRPTDGPTDGRTDRRTDMPSYRDARTHLKTKIDDRMDREVSYGKHGQTIESAVLKDDLKRNFLPPQ